MRNIGVSLPQAANGRFAAVILEPPVPGFGRLEPMATAATGNESSRPDAAICDCPLSGRSLAGSPVIDYFLGGGTFVENISRSSFHLASARCQTTMYFPWSIILPALSRNSYSPTSVAVGPWP